MKVLGLPLQKPDRNALVFALGFGCLALALGEMATLFVGSEGFLAVPIFAAGMAAGFAAKAVGPADTAGWRGALFVGATAAIVHFALRLAFFM